MRDLGLDYNSAAHGVQSAIRFEMTKLGIPDSGPIVDFIKHLRVGLDCRAADMAGLSGLLIKKKIISLNEYNEYMRLAMNEELARYQDHVRKTYGLPNGADFR
jgi:hypothetical protein